MIAASGINNITVEIMNNLFRSIAEQMSRTMVRTAYSTVVKEQEDCSAALFDARGRLIAEGANVPIHLNALGPVLKTVLEDHFPPHTMKPGDVIVTNDPYLGGGSVGPHHTADLVVIAPAFSGDDLLGFAVTMFHHRDVGAVWQSSIAWTLEIWQEGMRIPPLKLRDGGEDCLPVWNFILNNTRVPRDMRADLLSQVAACRVGVQGLQRIVERYGLATVNEAIDFLLDYAERRTRAEIEKIPDGVYEHEEVVLEDGTGGGPYTVKAKITVSGSNIEVDYTGTDPQIHGPINSPYSSTYSATLYTLRALTDPSIPTNDGGARPITVIAPEGTLVNCRLPAATFQRMIVCHSLVDLIMGALAPAIPDKVMADSCGCIYDRGSAINVKTHPKGGEVNHRQTWGEVVPGGLGARAGKDGLNVMACHVTNCPNPSLEAQEIEAPVLFLRKEFLPDSGGAGKFRGGLGQVRSWRVMGHDARWSHTSQKSVRPPQGFFGGKPGGVSRWIINAGTEKERVVTQAVGDVIFLEEGDTVTLETPGGGGYGNPFDRPVEMVVHDVRQGFVTPEKAWEHYGVWIEPGTGEVDWERTRSRRGEREAGTA